MPVGREVDSEEDGSERGERESGETLPAAPGKEEDGQPGAGDRPSGARELGGHASTCVPDERLARDLAVGG